MPDIDPRYGSGGDALIDRPTPKIIRADKTLRTVTAVGVGIALVAGLAALVQTESFLEDMSALARESPGEAAARIGLVLKVVTATVSLIPVSVGAYLLRVAARTRRTGEFPPPGTRVLRDTAVTARPASRHWATVSFIVAITLLLLGVLVPLVTWHLVGTLLNESPDPAARILEGAARAVRQPGNPPVDNVMARATVSGPSGPFETTVWSARDGRARMQQTTGFTAGVDRDTGWRWNTDTRSVSPLDSQDRRYLRGHELHAHVFFAEVRLADPVFTGRTVWDGDSALVVRFHDEADDTVFGAFSARDTLPLGLQVTSTDPDVFIRYDDWEWRGGIRVFTMAEFRQGFEIFRYEYTDIALGNVADSVFRPPR